MICIYCEREHDLPTPPATVECDCGAECRVGKKVDGTVTHAWFGYS